MVPAARPSTRLRFLDAARGVTMFFVMLSHFGSVYFDALESEHWRSALVRAGMIATPTFVILSGIMLGLQSHTSRDGVTRLTTRFVDRGLFLLFVGHLVISTALSRVERGGFQLYSTDVIGAAMILSVCCAPRLRGRTRLALAAIVYAVSWLAVYFWHPAEGVTSGEIAKELLFGSLHPTALIPGSFPIAPWFAVYLAGSVLGERLAVMDARGGRQRCVQMFAVLGATGMAVMVVVKLVAAATGLSPLAGNVSSALLRMGQKSPPGPLYLMFYGGIGLLLICACFVLEERQWLRRSFRRAEICGSASLFVYLVHFYVFWRGLTLLGPAGPELGLVYFLASTVPLVMAAHAWHRLRCNRIFTVRFKAVAGTLFDGWHSRVDSRENRPAAV
jgi:uncharacterized membrane protein